ncbi:MAG TPA: hypothetical protein VMB25_07495 [Bryobacteraceae bacterium]|nr:hypothetical protein [Bryobacteraceae bacterium]
MQGDFVIQVRPETDLDRGILRGRVEHMDSGQSVRFQTVEELVSFIAQHLQASDAEPSQTR